MAVSDRTAWSDADFDRMSWHDNHVHGLHLREGPYGQGELSLDLDYIVEWVCTPDGRCQFRIAPALLTFHAVTDLRILLDYAAATAGLVPFSLDGIRREAQAAGFPARWRLAINWPQGEISFAANGFSQTLRAPAVLADEQYLPPERRG